MSRFRDIKRQARRDVHSELYVAALYIPKAGATPVPCTVRVWRKREDPMTGDLPGFQGAAQMAVSEDRIRFFLPELPAIRRVGAIVSVEPGEAYRIEFLYPEDDEWQTARVVPLKDAETIGLPLPVDTATSLPAPSSPAVGIGVPAGGLTGDVLRKRSNADWDLVWVRGSFTFTQTTPTMIWNIPHNLGRIPVIAIVGADGREMDGEVAHSIPDYNTTQIIFSAPTSGAARLS